MNLQVRKRGGGLDAWNPDKVINSVAVAGLSQKEAEGLAILIEGWGERNSDNGILSSLQIRDKVIEVLEAVDSVAASAYKAFKK